MRLLRFSVSNAIEPAGQLACSVLHLDHEAPELLRRVLAALDLGQEVVLIFRGHRRDVRGDLLVHGELSEERRVVALSTPDAKSLALERRPHARGLAGTTSRERRADPRKTPDPSATPASTSTRPAIALAVRGSSRMVAP